MANVKKPLSSYIKGFQVIEDLGLRPVGRVGKARFAIFACKHCGKHFECNVNYIKTGNKRSCGCIGRMKRNSNLTINDIEYYINEREIKAILEGVVEKHGAQGIIKV